ncbi:hypothetical protein [Azospirillum sp. 11R-A]|uniref:hypothetical protein n=1 Tax=Azospirillum sp. 11R-A TaxID=3111634 RepID=UPI003C2EF30D
MSQSDLSVPKLCQAFPGTAAPRGGRCHHGDSCTKAARMRKGLNFSGVRSSSFKNPEGGGGRLMSVGIRLEPRHAIDRHDRHRQEQDRPMRPAAVAAFLGFSKQGTTIP